MNQQKMYTNITRQWLINNQKTNKLIVHKNGDMFKYKGKSFLIDNHDVVLDFKKGELEFAEWLSSMTSKRIEVFPRFNKPANKKSADFKIGKEYFDYKHTYGCSNQLIYHNLEKAKGQSYNFIINVTNNKINKHNILMQLNYTFRRLKWVKIIAIKSKYGFYVYKRKVEYIKKWNCYNNSTIKELGLGLVNFIAGELLKIYRIENLDYKEVEKFYNDIYANSMFKDFTSNISPKDIKDKNYIKKRMKINLITKNYKKTYKYYRYIIKISYKIKERLKKR
mgnify:CR=1 FL=1